MAIINENQILHLWGKVFKNGSMNNHGDQNNPSQRKKLADLKAVAAMLDVEDAMSLKEEISKIPYKPNEELIQTTSRIKNQRDLVLDRIQKMEAGRDRVSKTVYDKVHRDYVLQLESVNHLLAEKKSALKRELKRLYLLREREAMEITRHREILEEAQFRHFLEEFSEDQFKEVEEFETREINRLQSDLAHIHSYIRVHEELFDPQDLNLQPAPAAATTAPVSSSDVTRTILPQTATAPVSTHTMASAVIPPPPAPVPAEPAVTEPPPAASLQPPPPPAPMAPVQASAPAPSVSEQKSSEPAEPPVDDLVSELSGLHALAGVASQTTSPEPVSQTSADVSPDTGKTIIKTAAPAKEPESIMDVLGDLALESEPSHTGKITPNAAPEPDTASEPQAPTGAGAYLLITESESDLEFDRLPLKDNISIGRSPSNDLVLKAAKVSRQHAAINKYKDQYILIDLKSSNGVFVNGQKIDEYTLKNGDEIAIGGSKMTFKVPQ